MGALGPDRGVQRARGRFVRLSVLGYRITWVDDDWENHGSVGPFHPLFVPITHQGRGRFDNPKFYGALYVAHSKPAAVGELFGDYATWNDSVVERSLSGHRRCVVTYEIDDRATLLDLDDGRTLSQLSLRPTDVVRRNRDRTQEVALQLWLDRNETRRAGVSWWSYWRAEWPVSMLWSDDLDNTFEHVEILEVEPLTLEHSAVEVAADVLRRRLER